MAETRLVIIIPASNEEGYIRPCLEAVADQICDQSFLTIVSANACADRTVEIAKSCTDRFLCQGHELVVLSSDKPGKALALNRAERAIPSEFQHLPRLFLDADVTCEADLLGKILDTLSTTAPRFATGRISVTRAKSPFTRAYASVWCRLPFITEGATGAGLFAVNAAGRERWGEFPQIISDDTFVRLNFAADERIEVPAQYCWPMTEGLRALVKVRQRQDKGVQEVYSLYPHLCENEGKRKVRIGEFLKLGLTMPVGLFAYLLVHFLTRIGRSSEYWARGR